MQEEMLERISAICKVTMYLKHELSQDPHKLCVSLSELQAYGESCNAGISRVIGFILLPEVILYPSTQLYEWNTLLTFGAQTEMKQILSFLLDRRNSAESKEQDCRT